MISKERKNPFSIMAHQGYGELKVIHAGLTFVIPQSCLNSMGAVKVHLNRLIKNCNSIADAEKLYRFGIEVTTA